MAAARASRGVTTGCGSPPSPVSASRRPAPTRPRREAQEQRDEAGRQDQARDRAHDPVRAASRRPSRSMAPPVCHMRPWTTPAAVRSDEHRHHADDQQPERPAYRARVVARPCDPLPRVDQPAGRREAREPEHRHVRMADHPVGEVHRLVERHLRLQRPLHADDEIEQRARGDEAQAGIARPASRRRASTGTGWSRRSPPSRPSSADAAIAPTCAGIGITEKT